MTINDYNGTGRWTLISTRDRYYSLAATLGVHTPNFPEPYRHLSSRGEWIYPAMNGVIAQAEEGDRACVELGLELIETDQSMPFGRLIKIKAARMLRRADLFNDQMNRIRRRVLTIIDSNKICFEFRDYAKLLRSIGLPEDWREFCPNADSSNPCVHKYLLYFEAQASENGGVG